MDFTNYLPVLLIIVMAVGFVIVNIVASGLLGPKRSGDVKDSIYESGMNPIGTARKRFNIRFYILAMTFLVFDIEIIFLYPWAVDYSQLFRQVCQNPEVDSLYLARYVLAPILRFACQYSPLLLVSHPT